MRVFLTGATGYIGSAVVRALLRRGHEAVGLVRSEEKAGRLRGLGGHPVLGDLKDPRTFAEPAAACDAVVHAGLEYGPNVLEGERLAVGAILGAQRARKEPRAFVYTSGVWVLGPTGEKPADETSSTAKAASIVSWRPEMERTVVGASQGRLFAAVVRPGIVFGGRGGLIGGFFESANREGAAAVVGDGRNRWSPVHVDDLADLYVRIVELSATDRLRNLSPAERLFHGTDGTAETTEEIAAAAARAAGRDGRIQVQPLAEARQTMGSLADALAMDQAVVSPRSEAVLGWRPRFSGFVRNAGEAHAEWASPGF